MVKKSLTLRLSTLAITSPLKIHLFGWNQLFLFDFLSQAKHPDLGSAQKALRETQINMMFDWEQFGLTEDMFFKLYQCHRNQLMGNADLKARAVLIQKILAIETDLTLLFKIRQLTT